MLASRRGTNGPNHWAEGAEGAGPGAEIGGVDGYAARVDDLAKRLEMLVVLQWLDEGRPDDGAIRMSVTTAAADLEAGEGRAGVLAVMSALTDLDERGLVRVSLSAAGPREPLVTLSDGLRRDANRLFGADRRTPS